MHRKIFLTVIILASLASCTTKKTIIEKKDVREEITSRIETPAFGNLILDLDAAALADGPVTNWENKGSLGGKFISEFGGGATVQSVDGRTAVTFNGTSNYLVSSFTAPDSITANSGWTIAVRAYNPNIGVEECMINWAHRGESPRCAQINYGTSRDYGAVTHWSTPDMGFEGGVPAAGKWHLIIVSYEGGKDGTEKIYVNGQLNAAEDKTLNLWSDEPIYLGCANGGNFFSGSLAEVFIYDYPLTEDEIGYLADANGQEPKPALVHLKAEGLPTGLLENWPNNGILGGNFGLESSSPVAETIDGRAAVTFGKSKWLKSTFKLPDSMAGNTPFTIILQAYKPEISNNTETMVSLAPSQSRGHLRFNYGNQRRKTAFAAGRNTAAYKDKVPDAGNWHYIAYTYSAQDDGDFRIYVDGELDTSKTFALNLSAEEIYLGSIWDRRRDASANPFYGSLSKIQIYDGALPQIAIREKIGLYTAFNPRPTVGQIVETLKPILQWDKGTTEAKSYKLYFSTDRDEVLSTHKNALKASQPADDIDFGPVQVNLGQTYYWRIDQLDKTSLAKWQGQVWEFTVETGQAEEPIPRNKIASVDIDTKKLKWIPGKYAKSQDFYFGTSLNEVEESIKPTIKNLDADVVECEIPIQLEYGKTYYWRVDENNGKLGISKGQVWCFRTDDKVEYNDITFFVGSDIHYGASDTIRNAIRATIDVMNWLPGTKYPQSAGSGVVETPRGVVFCGDLTNDGNKAEWEQFLEDFGVNGEGQLIYPVYEGLGNHDGDWNGAVRDGIKERNKKRLNLTKISDNGLHFSWDWDQLHLVQLNIYAGDKRIKEGNLDGTWNEPDYSLSFLIEDLAENVGDSGRPVILFQHYGWDGFSEGWGWWAQAERQAFYEAIKNYNIIGIFWGHTHAVEFTEWDGISIYNDASVQRDPDVGEFLVVHITEDEMTVAHRFSNRWGNYIKKTIYGMEAGEKTEELKVEAGK